MKNKKRIWIISKLFVQFGLLWLHRVFIALAVSLAAKKAFICSETMADRSVQVTMACLTNIQY